MKFDTDAPQRLERVLQQLILALGVDRRAPELWRIPGEADLQPTAQRRDVDVSRSSDEAICLDVSNGKGNRGVVVTLGERPDDIILHYFHRARPIERVSPDLLALSRLQQGVGVLH